MTDKIIKFRRDTSFRKQFFVLDSFAHPAKMDAQLLIWIVEKFTKEGETILDPMFGSGTTMLACILGRNVIGIELEQKFIDMAKANWEKVRQKPMLGSVMGTCQILQGDARNLEGLLVDKCVFSPPYTTEPFVDKQFMEREGKDRKVAMEHPDSIDRLPYGEIDKCIFSPPYAESQADDKAQKSRVERYPELKGKGGGIITGSYSHQDSKDNIANLPYGQVDKIVTSPPYAGDKRFGREFTDASIEGRDKHLAMKYGDTEGQVGKLPYGSIDSVITSPPYEEMRLNHLSDIEKRAERMRSQSISEKVIKHTLSCGMKQEYSDKVDAILTSPPYEDYTCKGTSETAKQHNIGQSDYGKHPLQIGNLKSTSYLEAMAQVYRQCYRVLRPQGLMILVTKNFIREQKEVRLDSDTIKLCEQVGFQFQERWYRELPAQSFWRVIYKKKFPDAPQLKFEDVLIFQK